MANIQIYQLDNVGSDLDNSAILAADITNPDASERATTPKVTRGVSMQQLEQQILNEDEYTTALDTTNKTIFGAINEQQTVIGYSYDAYDATTAYSTGDLCIYNNVLYKAKQATTGNLPTNTTYWEPTSIADAINELNTGKADASDITANALRSTLTLDNFAVYSAERILANATKDIPLTQNLFVLFIKSYADARTFGVYLISYHGSVATSQYISTVAQGSYSMPTLSIVDGNKLRIATGVIDVYYSMLRLN